MTISKKLVRHLLHVVAVIPATTANADVLEIGDKGPQWRAGGPAQVQSRETRSQDAGPVTTILPSAGPAAWRPLVKAVADRYEISPALLEAVVWQESRWHPGAVSPAGARGLAQLMPGTARHLGVNPDDPVANLHGGARYLKAQLITFNGDVEKALAAYNAGPGRVVRANGVPKIRETQNYVAAIMNRLSSSVRSSE